LRLVGLIEIGLGRLVIAIAFSAQKLALRRGGAAIGALVIALIVTLIIAALITVILIAAILVALIGIGVTALIIAATIAGVAQMLAPIAAAGNGCAGEGAQTGAGQNRAVIAVFLVAASAVIAVAATIAAPVIIAMTSRPR
jgi:hypothetical protein